LPGVCSFGMAPSSFPRSGASKKPRAVQWLSTTSGYIHVRSEHVELAWRNANQRVEARFAEER